MPRGVPRLGWAVYLRQWRQTHKALGLCRCCSVKAVEGLSVCQRHREYINAKKRKVAA